MLDVRFWLEDGERLPALEGLHSGANGLGGQVARTGRPIAAVDYVAECQRVGTIPDGPVTDEIEIGLQMSWVGVPIVSRGLVLGVLSASQNRGEPFDATLVELLETLAAHSSMALENLSLRAEDAVRRAELEARAAETAESELRYRLLFEHNPHPMWVFDLETLIFLAVNEAAVRHYGYSRDEFLAMQITDLRLPEDVPDFLTRIRAVRGYGRRLDPSQERRRAHHGRHCLAHHRVRPPQRALQRHDRYHRSPAGSGGPPAAGAAR